MVFFLVSPSISSVCAFLHRTLHHIQTYGTDSVDKSSDQLLASAQEALCRLTEMNLVNITENEHLSITALGKAVFKGLCRINCNR